MYKFFYFWKQTVVLNYEFDWGLHSKIKISGLTNSNCRLEMLLFLCVLLTLQKGKEILFGIYNFSNRKLKFKKSRSFSNHRSDPNCRTNFRICKFWPFKSFLVKSMNILSVFKNKPKHFYQPYMQRVKRVIRTF